MKVKINLDSTLLFSGVFCLWVILCNFLYETPLVQIAVINVVTK